MYRNRLSIFIDQNLEFYAFFNNPSVIVGLLFASQLFNQVIYDIGITHEMEAKVWVVKHLADIGIIENL